MHMFNGVNWKHICYVVHFYISTTTIQYPFNSSFQHSSHGIQRLPTWYEAVKSVNEAVSGMLQCACSVTRTLGDSMDICGVHPSRAVVGSLGTVF